MSILTITRTTEEHKLLPDAQPAQPSVTTAQPPSAWPLPGTQLPGAHLTWAEWVARLAARLARERHDEHPARVKASAAAY